MAKTAFITGASRGIGRAAAFVFAEEGYSVCLLYNHSESEAKNAVRQIKAKGGYAIAVKADVANETEVEKAVDTCLDTFGKIDVLVNNAGIAQQKLFTDITTQEWQRMFDVHVNGAFYATKAVVPHMISKKAGSIINVSSVWGIAGASCEVHYSAAKAALIGFTKALAKELGPSGIRVNCIAPGVIDTDMCNAFDEETIRGLCEETPLERIGTPEEVAKCICFLASENAAFMTGQVLRVDGGFAI